MAKAEEHITVALDTANLQTIADDLKAAVAARLDAIEARLAAIEQSGPGRLAKREGELKSVFNKALDNAGGR